MARIDDKAQDDAVLELTKGGRALIGLHDTDQDGQFKWMDGSNPVYVNWAPGEPSTHKS